MQQIIEKLIALEKSKSGNFPQNEPITPNEIKQLQETLGFDIPDQLLQLLQLYNGDCEGGDRTLVGSFSCLLNSNNIITHYLELTKLASKSGGLDKEEDANPDKRIKNYQWSKKWIPFLLANDLVYAIDLSPTESGFVGQIILPIWENNESYFCASSLTNFFEKIYKFKTQEFDKSEVASFFNLDFP